MVWTVLVLEERMKKKVALHNLGCKVNSYELEAMQQLLEQAGYEIWLNLKKNTSVRLILLRLIRQRNMKNWKSAAQLSMYVLILRCRMAVTSFAPIVSFPMQEAACEAGKKRIF